MTDQRYKPGRCYFLVGYLDKKFQFPFVQSYVFIGTRGEGREARWLFQDVHSYCKEGQHERSEDSKGIDVMALDKESLGTMLSASGLVEEFERLEI